MTARHAKELLYDSEAALRLVDSAIEDIRDARPTEPAEHTDAREQPVVAAALENGEASAVLARSYGELVSVLGSLRQSRNILQHTTVAKSHSAQAEHITSQQLSYASSVLTELEARLAELASVLDSARTSPGT